MPPRTPYEKEVQAECLNWLNSQPNIYAWRRTIGVFKVGPRTIRVNKKGQSDIEGIIQVGQLHSGGSFGAHLEIETKRIGNEPTTDQTVWLLAVEALGGIAFWCNSLDMMKAKLKAELDCRHWRHSGPPSPGGRSLAG